MTFIYRSIMDTNSNALNILPPAQRFQIMAYLGMMWTTIFCVSTGAWIWYGHLMILHVGMAFGFMITGWTFHTARKSGIYRDHPREDGTARYDDVWGG